MDSVELKMNWENGYGPLNKGDYRLVKKVSVEKTDGSIEEFEVFCKFYIE